MFIGGSTLSMHKDHKDQEDHFLPNNCSTNMFDIPLPKISNPRRVQITEAISSFHVSKQGVNHWFVAHIATCLARPSPQVILILSERKLTPRLVNVVYLRRWHYTLHACEVNSLDNLQMFPTIQKWSIGTDMATLIESPSYADSILRWHSSKFPSSFNCFVILKKACKSRERGVRLWRGVC